MSKISGINSVSDDVKNGNDLLFCSGVTALNNGQKCFCRTLGCHGEVDLWLFEYKMSPCYHFTFLDICATCCHNSLWILRLWLQTCFVRLQWPSLPQNTKSKWMFVPNLKKNPQGIPEISRSQEWDGRMYGQTDRQTENLIA